LGKISGNAFSTDVITAVDSLFRSKTVTGDMAEYFRVRSLASEASFFGMYIAILLPWILGRCFLDRSRYPSIFFFIFGYVIVLVLFSLSRTAYILRLGVFVVGFFAVTMVSFDYVSNTLPETDIGAVYESLFSNDNLSNVARYGSQLAAWNMFLDHPLFGVGYGMYGFYAPQYYPVEAWRSIEIGMWASNGVGWPWPPTHNLYARVLAELGGVGLMVYLSLLSSLFFRIWRCCVSRDVKQGTDARLLAMTLLGVVLQGFNVDAFRSISMWIVFALVLNVTIEGRESL